MKTRMIVLAACVLLVAVAGCRKNEGAASRSASEVLDVWKAAGLSPGEFRDVDGTRLGGKCLSGSVEGVEATLCTYADEAAARQAEAKGLELVGDVTGAAKVSGKMLVVLADRKNTDPNGKRINALLKALAR